MRKCKRCKGTGDYVPPTPDPDPDELAAAQEWLRAEEEFTTGVPAQWNDTAMPVLTVCPDCHGSGRVDEGLL